MSNSAKNTFVGAGGDSTPPAGERSAAPARKRPSPGDKRVCDDCLDPNAVLAVQCDECEQVLCADCDQRIHKKGTRATHQRGPYTEGAAPAPANDPSAMTKHTCQDCQDPANEVVCHCQECEQFLCRDCDQRIHKKGTRSKHVRDYINADNPGGGGGGAGASSATSSMIGVASPRADIASPKKSADDGGKEALGNAAFNNKKYDKAASYFTELITQNPSGWKYFLKRCNCYFFMEKYQDSLSDANQVIELAPQVLEGYASKGKALEKMGQTADAITAVQEGLRIDPGNVPLKQALAKLKEVNEAPPPAGEAPAPAKGGRGHSRQPSRPPPPPTKTPPSSAVSVFNPTAKAHEARPTMADWDGEKDDEMHKKDKSDAAGLTAGLRATSPGGRNKLDTGAAAADKKEGKKGPPPLPGGGAAKKKEPPPLKKLDKSKTEAIERALSPSKAKEAEKKKEEEEEAAPPPPAEEGAPPAGGDELWQEHFDSSSGKKYWHNTQTQETTWDDPKTKEEEWGEAKDPSTGKTYWYNTKTGATTWENPHGSEWAESSDPATGKPFWYHIVTGQTTWDNPSESGKKKENVAADGPAIPAGMAVPKVVTVKNSEWSEHKDAGSGNVYYVNNKTQVTTWSNPHQWNEWVDKGSGKKYWHNEVTNVTTWEYPK